jgi:hypothetical protein
MADGPDRDSAVPWIDDRRAREQPSSAAPEVEVVSDPESDTVTFVSQGTERDTTTAWITVDAGLVVDVAEHQ